MTCLGVILIWFTLLGSITGHGDGIEKNGKQLKHH